MLLAAYLLFWVLMAVDPLYRFDWFLENIVIFLSLPLVIVSYFRFRLSDRSYILMFLFAFLHTAAAHYTYGDTPWGDALSALMGWERNHFDRAVHFLFGLLMTPVAFEILAPYLPSKKFFQCLFVFGIIFSIGSLYEIAEFAVGVLVSPEQGLGFLGFQGDIWDTQKDMVLQTLGALMGIAAIVFSRRIFVRER